MTLKNLKLSNDVWTSNETSAYVESVAKQYESDSTAKILHSSENLYTVDSISCDLSNDEDDGGFYGICTNENITVLGTKQSGFYWMVNETKEIHPSDTLISGNDTKFRVKRIIYDTDKFIAVAYVSNKKLRTYVSSDGKSWTMTKELVYEGNRVCDIYTNIVKVDSTYYIPYGLGFVKSSNLTDWTTVTCPTEGDLDTTKNGFTYVIPGTNTKSLLLFNSVFGINTHGESNNGMMRIMKYDIESQTFASEYISYNFSTIGYTRPTCHLTDGNRILFGFYGNGAIISTVDDFATFTKNPLIDGIVPNATTKTDVGLPLDIFKKDNYYFYITTGSNPNKGCIVISRDAINWHKSIVLNERIEGGAISVNNGFLAAKRCNRSSGIMPEIAMIGFNCQSLMSYVNDIDLYEKIDAQDNYLCTKIDSQDNQLCDLITKTLKVLDGTNNKFVVNITSDNTTLSIYTPTVLDYANYVTIDFGDYQKKYSIAEFPVQHTYLCAGEYEVTIGNTVENFNTIEYGKRQLDGVAVSHYIKSAKLNGSSLSNVFYSTFVSNWDSLENVDMRGTNAKVLNRTFNDCPKLSSVLLPDTIEEITNAAFNGCSKLNLTLPPNLKIIGSNAFANQYSSPLMQNLHEIPSSVVEIGSEAFRENSGLSGTIMIHNTLQKLSGVKIFGWYASVPTGAKDIVLDMTEYDGTVDDATGKVAYPILDRDGVTRTFLNTVFISRNKKGIKMKQATLDKIQSDIASSVEYASNWQSLIDGDYIEIVD